MYSNIIRHNSKMNMLIISKGQKLVEMHQDKPNQVYEGTCIPASNPMLCIIWNAVSSYMWFCVLHSTICQISDQTLSKKMRVALHSQAHDTENEIGEKKNTSHQLLGLRAKVWVDSDDEGCRRAEHLQQLSR